jgi:hypothetical protein
VKINGQVIAGVGKRAGPQGVRTVDELAARYVQLTAAGRYFTGQRAIHEL